MGKNKLKEIKRSSLSGSIVNQIREAIINGEYKPGDRLPAERELTKIFNVSRIPLREAIKRLEQMGLLVVKPGEGAFISIPSTEELLEPLISNIILSKKDNFYLIEVRRIIETSAIKLVIERATEDEVKKLNKIIKKLKKCINNNDEFSNEDLNFHIELVRATMNPVLLKLIYTIRNLLIVEIKNNQKKMGVKERSIKLHEKILKTIIDKDVNAAVKAMNAHFDFMDSLLGDLKNSLKMKEKK